MPTPPTRALTIADLFRQRSTLLEDLRAADRPDALWLADRVEELSYLNRELVRLGAFAAA